MMVWTGRVSKTDERAVEVQVEKWLLYALGFLLYFTGLLEYFGFNDGDWKAALTVVIGVSMMLTGWLVSRLHYENSEAFKEKRFVALKT